MIASSEPWLEEWRVFARHLLGVSGQLEYVFRPADRETRSGVQAWQMAAPGYPLRDYESDLRGLWVLYIAASHEGQGVWAGHLIDPEAKCIGASARKQANVAREWMQANCPPLERLLREIEIKNDGWMRYTGSTSIRTLHEP